MIAVIPAYNAGTKIGRVVELARNHVSQVWVGDDGSADSTAAEARSSGALLFQHTTNQGKGAMLRTLFAAAVADNVPGLICLDADGQHDPNDIPAFLQAHAQNPEAILIGNRIQRAGVMPIPRRCAVSFSSAWISSLAGITLPDAQCGFRLLTRYHLLSVQTREQRFVMETEFLVRAARAHIPLLPIPIHSSYPAENRSHFRACRDSLAIAGWLFRSTLRWKA